MSETTKDRSGPFYEKKDRKTFGPAPCEFKLPLPAPYFRWMMHNIGWSPAELARRLGTSESKVEHYTTGKSFVPHRLALWMQGISNYMANVGLPIGWDDNQRAGDKHLPLDANIEHAYDPVVGRPRTLIPAADDLPGEDDDPLRRVAERLSK